MAISERKKKILAAVVEEYIRTAEPVGSKAIAQNAGLGCSSATIRNELAELTSLGFLEQPHTSAGRIPTPAGYRMYVNELMQRQKLSLEETEEINARMNQKLQQLDHTVQTEGAAIPVIAVDILQSLFQIHHLNPSFNSGLGGQRTAQNLYFSFFLGGQIPMCWKIFALNSRLMISASTTMVIANWTDRVLRKNRKPLPETKPSAQL